MFLCHHAGLCALFLIVIGSSGCQTPASRHPAVRSQTGTPGWASVRTGAEAPVTTVAVANPDGKVRLCAESADENGSVTTIAHEAQAIEPVAETAAGVSDDPFAGQPVLSLALLDAEVLARNQSLQAALAAAHAAAERCPQVTALDDPMFQSMYAPATFARTSPTQSSYMLGVAQKIPWSGKLELRGQMANWEAAAMSSDFQDARLRVVEAARLSFFAYYLVDQELVLNSANLEAMEEFRETARARYESNLVTQQDVLQAEVELAKLAQERIDLNQSRQVVIAQINTLLHRSPDHFLPPPPQQLASPDRLPAAEQLRQLAVEQRPDLAAKGARLHAEQNAIALACKEFYPDFELTGRYDAFWTDTRQRPSIGLNMNIPLNQNRRRAAVREAMFRVSKLQAEYDQQADNIQNDVQAGCARVDASRQTVELYANRILPAARDNVSSAVSGYTAGKLDFLRLIEAQRELIELQNNQQAAIAEYHRRRAELDRVIGTPLSDGPVRASLPEFSAKDPVTVPPPAD